MKTIHIFVTTGTQLPFARLIDSINFWASTNSEHKIIAQTASAEGEWPHIQIEKFVSPARYEELVKWADIIVAHAGMGTIITGIEYEKPLILMPRLFEKGEHRNDHQVATAEKFSQTSGIKIVHNQQELIDALNSPNKLLTPGAPTGTNRSLLLSHLENLLLE